MNVRIVLACLMLAAACTSDPAPKPTASATPEPKGLVVAVPLGATGVSLYRIGEDRRAVLLHTLLSPRDHPQQRPLDLSLSADPRPDTCAVWNDSGQAGSGQSAIICYPFGETTAPTLKGSQGAAAVALSADGTHVAWLSDTWVELNGTERSLTEQRISIGRYSSGKVMGVRTTRVYSGSGNVDTQVGCEGVEDLTWAGNRLVLECDGIDNTPGGLQLQAPDLRGDSVSVGAMAGPYNYYAGVAADATSGVGIQGEYCDTQCSNGPSVERRAVRFDLTTGKMLEVIATPAAGRYMVSVSGGAHGIVYSTGGQRANTVYVRFPGEKHGTRVAGLPDAEGTLLAQP